MFKILYKDTGEAFQVYDVTYDSNGYAQFLVYMDGQWLRLSAKHFIPEELLPII